MIKNPLQIDEFLPSDPVLYKVQSTHTGPAFAEFQHL